MTNRPLTVNVNYAFILLNILIWLVLGVIIAFDVHPALPDIPVMKGIMAGLSLAIACILLVLFIYLYKSNKTAYYLMLAFFAVSSILTILDDVGLSDLVVLLINIIPIVLLLKDRVWYLREKSNLT